MAEEDIDVTFNIGEEPEISADLSINEEPELNAVFSIDLTPNIIAGKNISIEKDGFDSVISVKDKPYNLQLSKYEDYLYSVHYYPDQLDYENALEYFYNNFHNSNINYNGGACSAIRKDNYFARNYDWYYSEAVSFVVKKEGNEDRYSSIGMAGGIPKLSKEFVESGDWDNMYNILPFFLVDGINEHGVTVTINVVPAGDNGKTTGTHPEKTGDEICMLQLPSYILDNFASAQQAVDWILNEAKIYAPYNETTKEEMHFMIADKNNTYIVEFINNEAVLVDNGRNYLTNFYLTGTELDANNKVNPNTVTPYGQGLERYNIITENLDKEPREILELLKYTNAYNIEDLSKWWMTEFVAPYADMGYTYPNLTVLNTPQDFIDCGLLTRILDLYQHRTRDGASTWQTVHGAVYDINKLEFTLLVQEESVEKTKTFQLFPNTGDGKLIIKSDNEIIGSFTANQQLDTEINIDIESSIEEERQVRIEADEILQGNINTVSNNLTEEINNRQSNDADLQNQINSEIISRQNADTELQQNINSEASVRAQNDTLLQNDINIVSTNLTAEIGYRESSDTNLQNQITSIDNTINTYGDIVTHNVDEFATAEQGSLADTAIQPNNDISLLTNDIGYITKAVNNLDNYTKTSELADVALSGAYSDLSGQPTDLSQFNNDTNYITLQNISGTTPINYSKTTGVISVASNYQIPTTAQANQITTNQNNITAINNTLDTYGDIVTHDFDEFATASQGVKADTALQPTDIVNNITSTATNKVLSANMGKELQDQITNLTGRGTYLSIWNCTTGLAMTTPTVIPRVYKSGDWFLVGYVGTTNYKPTGTAYDPSIPSTEIETSSVKVNDAYYYDGENWTLLDTPQVDVAFSTLAGSPYDNTNLSNALNDKAEDDEVVHLTGAETVAPKTFETTGVASSVILNNTTNSSALEFRKMGVTQGYIGVSASKVPFFANNISSSWVNIVRSTLNTAVGSATQPVYINGSGVTTACTAYSDYHDSTKQDVIDEYTSQEIQTLWENT